MNSVILSGRLARDPEFFWSTGDNPIAVCRFTVAVRRGYKTEDNAADFISCVAFRRTAENISTYFRKGNRISLQGQIHQSRYLSSENIRKTVVEVVVRSFEFVDPKNSSPSPVCTENTLAGPGFRIYAVSPENTGAGYTVTDVNTDSSLTVSDAV